ncbi:class A beta-lactamase [Pleomorphomonas diazotrophica]|uniref:Beta-lactamase n=1 Tax=Pleomorphomonas diazotrophica TaxID=1166257 RepID=A0A1I4W7A1_9HYPH|nr:class A beta-lactamase [Pleomorphomonas diazotrophica]PKR87910.1 class A beta-lactamase [Pleomorphomonas diazotrophica]SFN09086.1 beta-lactamase class A [Pleomorphomonas diazotrophica]
MHDLLFPTRRSLLGTAATAGLGLMLAGRALAADDELAALEKRSGGRLGVAALDKATGARLVHRADERFAMCSTFKFVAAAAVLAAVDQGKLRLDKSISYGKADLQDYAPVAKEHVAEGSLSLEVLCRAAVEMSDNTAANLILKEIGGPAGWTAYVRALGDATSRLDRTEPSLNTADEGDERDTTTPEAMMGTLDALMVGNALSETSRKKLEEWMLTGIVTGPLIRAGVPKTWQVADKSGSGGHGTRNDVGIIYRPEKAPILASIYFTGSDLDMPGRNKVIADTAAIIAARFG